MAVVQKIKNRNRKSSQGGSAAQHVWGRVVDLVLPPRCVVSGAIVDRPGVLAPGAWRDLRFIGAPFCAGCGLPFDFPGDPGAKCVSCLDIPPSFETARSALVYDDASREIILKFKHADALHAIPVFVPWLKQAGKEMLALADLIVPVPLHRTRLLKRRYNQAALLAQALARESGVPCVPDLLCRTRATLTQGHMNVTDRHKNVRNAFAVREKHRTVLNGKTVLLLDDVYTTGATVSACSKALCKAGAKAVHVLTVARVVRS
ncbi:MAG: ComF family protein [Alphaproteobacteria bacterium]|nr:ComF family protein [Alphaproteobacteria bacterium]